MPTKQQKPKEKKWNGKPMSHWETMAKRHVVDHLVRGSMQYADTNCLPREIASRRLMELALQTDRFMVREVLEEREMFRKGTAMAIAEMLLPDKDYYRLRTKQLKRRKRSKRVATDLKTGRLK